MDDAQRQAVINTLITTDTKKVAPMSFWEELSMVLFFGLGLPGAVFTVPAIIAIIGYCYGSIKLAFLVAAVVLDKVALEKHPLFTALGFKYVAPPAQKKKKEVCSECIQYKAEKPTDKVAPCVLFANLGVPAEAYCNSFARKAAEPKAPKKAAKKA